MMNKQNRAKSKLTFLLTISLILLLVTACGTKGGSVNESSPNSSVSSAPAQESDSDAPAADSQEPIKIGALLDFTGPLAPLGESIRRGFDLFLEQNDYTIGGRKVEVRYEDSEGKTQSAVRKYRQLVDSYKADLLVAPISSSILSTLRDQVEKDKILMINPNAGSNGVSWEQKSDYLYRIAVSNWQNGNAPAKYFADNIAKTVYTLGSDNPAGHEVIDAFTTAFEAAGGKVIGQGWPKVGAPDFATYLTDIRNSGAEMLTVFIIGSDGTRFVSQFDQFGLKDKIIFGSTYTNNDRAIVGSVEEAADGIISPQFYNPYWETEINQKFVKDYEAKYKMLPDYTSVYGYDTGSAIKAAIEKAGSSKTEDLIKVFPGLEFPSPRGGKVMIDPKTHNPIHNFDMVRNVYKDGKLTYEKLAELGPVIMPEKNPYIK